MGHAERALRSPAMPRLDDAMRRPVLQGRVQFDQTVKVPVLEKRLQGLYAYQNGRLNLVKPQVFKTSPIDTAVDLATRGRLIHQHPDPKEGERQLIVVSEVRTPEPPPDLQARISELFGEFDTRVVWHEQIDEFVAEVEREAHP